MCVYTCMCVHQHTYVGACRSQKMVLGGLELELEASVSHQTKVLATELWSSAVSGKCS